MTLIKYFGEGFWSLIPFTMQMALIIIGGHTVASSPPIHRLILKTRGSASHPRGAAVLIALFSTLTSLISWGLSLIMTGFSCARS
jgi:short-chain fatty acids transporter